MILLLQDHLPLAWIEIVQANWSSCGKETSIGLVGLGTTGVLNVSSISHDSNAEFGYFSDENEKYFIYSVDKSITYSRYKISPEGIIEEVGNGTAPFGACSVGLEAGDDQKAGCTKKKLQPECRDPNIQFVFESSYTSTDGFKFPEND